MKKIGQWKEDLVTSLEIPRDLAMKETIVTVTGRHQVVVCNYRSILRYEKEEIILLTFRGKLQIRGKRLQIPLYTPEEMYIQGVILEIILETLGGIYEREDWVSKRLCQGADSGRADGTVSESVQGTKD